MKNKIFMPYKGKMSLKDLQQLVDNWLWEGPLEFAPDEAQTLKLIELIEKRPDAAKCSNILKSCKEYLSVLNPADPNKKTPTVLTPREPIP